MPPIYAQVVQPSSEPLGQLHPIERDYVRGLKKRERSDLIRLLDGNKRKRGGGGHHEASVNVPLRIQVLQSRLSEATRLSIFQEMRGGVCEKYLSWVRRALTLPLGVAHPLPTAPSTAAAVAHAQRTLDAIVSGHDLAKREVLKMVCQAYSGGTCASAYSLGLEGPPGTGKTHFVRHALAPALARPFVSIPLGGATDISYLLGNIYTYEGSKEGRLAAGLIEAGCSNPVIHFDEVDKISQTERGSEIANVLLHLVDPSSNTTLRDRFFHGIDIDFSKCTFVFSYNDPSRVSPILLDRIKRVPMRAPTLEERTEIVRTHLLPRARVRLHTSLDFSDAAVDVLLARATEGEGMRHLEKDLDHVLSAAQLEAVLDTTTAVSAAPKHLDPQGRIGADFTRDCLRALDDGMPTDHSRPPHGMYT